MRRISYFNTIFNLAALFSAALLFIPVAGMAAQHQKTNIMAENVLDMDIRTTTGENVGEIQDVLFDRTGKIREFLVDVGGFLGIGEKTVSVSTGDLRYNKAHGYAIFQGTRSELENKPQVDYSEYRFAREGYPYWARDGYGYPYGPGYGYPYPYYDQPGWARQYPPRGYYDNERGYYGNEDEDRYGSMDGRHHQGMQGRPRSNMQRHMQNRAWGDQERYHEPMGGANRFYYGNRPIGRNSELSMNNMIGTDVRTYSGESVGEIENMVISPRGKITHVIIDVGGFLGIGAKKVAVPFDRLDHFGPYFVVYPGTEEQLESMQAFNKNEYLGDTRSWSGKSKSENGQMTENNRLETAEPTNNTSN